MFPPPEVLQEPARTPPRVERDAQGRVVGGRLNPAGRPKGRHAGGRPPKLTAELEATLVNALKAGNYLEIACKFAGIDRKSVYAWLDRGRAGEPRYVQFLHTIEAAQAHAEVRAVALLAKAAEKNWQAACAFLERRCGERWAKREQLRLNTEAPMQPFIVHVTADPAQGRQVGTTIDPGGELPAIHFHPRTSEPAPGDPPPPDPSEPGPGLSPPGPPSRSTPITRRAPRGA